MLLDVEPGDTIAAVKERVEIEEGFASRWQQIFLDADLRTPAGVGDPDRQRSVWSARSVELADSQPLSSLNNDAKVGSVELPSWTLPPLQLCLRPLKITVEMSLRAAPCTPRERELKHPPPRPSTPPPQPAAKPTPRPSGTTTFEIEALVSDTIESVKEKIQSAVGTP